MSSIFGSRDEDPLLQDDPFAPSPGGESSSSSGDPVSESDAQAADEQPNTPRTEEKTRRLLYTREEATGGELAELNRALAGHWRLSRVKLRDDGRIAFVLAAESSSANGLGTIV
jgi:hypothetical protein